MKIFFLLCVFLTTNLSLADTLRLNRSTITERTYECSNGGSIKLQNTRFGNVKKVVFSKDGQADEYNYVKFWNMTDYYEGRMVTWIKIPKGPIKDDLQEGQRTADMTIRDDGIKFIMTIAPIRIDSSFREFSCLGS